MPEYNPCPTCYNYISEDRGDRGSQGTDENGDPLPFWSNDPILTPLGLSGDDYKGMDLPKLIHYQELREYYNNLETDLGLTNTVWTDDLTDTTKKFTPKKEYIEELRTAIEALLLEKDLNIIDYFSLDRYGNAIETTQTDWTDIERGEFNSPLLPDKTIIKAIHIEELRRGIYLIAMFLETWTDNTPTLIESDSYSIIQPAYPEPLLPGHYGFNNIYSPIEADNIWYEMIHNFQVTCYNREESIYGQTSINLSGGNLIYNGNITATGTYYRDYGTASFSSRLLLAQIPPDVKKIKPNSILSWSGNWEGSVIPEDNYSCRSYAYIRLHLYELSPYRGDILVTLIKYANGSLSIVEGLQYAYLLASWGQELNLYDILNTVGLDTVNKQYYINYISFRFEASCPNIYIGRSNLRQASIEGSIDNIRIG